MAQHKIDHRGFVTTGPVDGTCSTIVSGSRATFASPVTFSAGTSFSGTSSFAGTVNFSQAPHILPSYQLLRDTNTKSFAGALVHHLLGVSGTLMNSGSSFFYNTASYTFFPTAVGKVYDMRTDGVLSASSGTPIFHVDFEQTGIIVTGSNHGTHIGATLNRQTEDFESVRAAVGHSHFHMTFLVFATPELVASGHSFIAPPMVPKP